MKEYFADDNVYEFEGCISVQKEKDWVSPWRIDFSKREFYPFLIDDIRKDWTAPPAAQCSGVRLAFETDSSKIELVLFQPEEGLKLDLFVNGIYQETKVINKPESRILFNNMSDDNKEIDIWLDQRHRFQLQKILIIKNSKIRKCKRYKKKWVHYGSSISHSRQAAGPSSTWTSIAARKLDLHLTNLGFGANCVIEPMMARAIRDLPADYISLKLGINVHDGKLVYRTFLPNVIGMIEIIREKHPKTPLALISPIYSPEREKSRNLGNSMSLEEMRVCLSEVVKVFNKYSDDNIYYVDGREIFGQNELVYMPDNLHPDAKGQFIMAEHFIDYVFNRYLL